MNHSGQGRTRALAEMSPFGRPVMIGGNGDAGQSGWKPATYPIDVGADSNPDGDNDYEPEYGEWQRPSYRMNIGFDPGTFLSQNKVAVALAAALLVGGVAYYYTR